VVVVALIALKANEFASMLEVALSYSSWQGGDRERDLRLK
jgi:hypothetical protein